MKTEDFLFGSWEFETEAFCVFPLEYSRVFASFKSFSETCEQILNNYGYSSEIWDVAHIEDSDIVFTAKEYQLRKWYPKYKKIFASECASPIGFLLSKKPHAEWEAILGVSRQTLHNWITRRTQPRAEDLFKILAASSHDAVDRFMRGIRTCSQ